MAENARLSRRTVIVVLCCQALATAAVVLFLIWRPSSEATPVLEPKPAEGPTPAQLKTMRENLATIEREKKVAEGRALGAQDVPEEIERGMMMDAAMRQKILLPTGDPKITTSAQFNLDPNVIKK